MIVFLFIPKIKYKLISSKRNIIIIPTVFLKANQKLNNILFKNN